MSSGKEYNFVWMMIYYPLVVLMLFINCFSDSDPAYIGELSKEDVIWTDDIDHEDRFLMANDCVCPSQNPSPEEKASFPSRLVYQWFDAMIWKGYKKPLEGKDLCDMNFDDKARNVVPRFDKHWEKSLRKKTKYEPSTLVFRLIYLSIQ